METLKRKIKFERGENQEKMTASLINGRRLSLRWADDPKTDVVINFTKEETDNVRSALNCDC